MSDTKTKVCTVRFIRNGRDTRRYEIVWWSMEACCQVFRDNFRDDKDSLIQPITALWRPGLMIRHERISHCPFCGAEIYMEDRSGPGLK